MGHSMSDDSFDLSWLELRERADHRARAHELADRLEGVGQLCGWSVVLDLGSGTGSNLRYLAPRLPWVDSWVLLDQDSSLLKTARAPGVPEPIRSIGDIAVEGMGAIASADVVTASALLDLVSRDWLSDTVKSCAAKGAAALFSLSYNGDIRWSIEDPDDVIVRDAVNEHQRRIKGLGRALGPEAPIVARTLFMEFGYDVLLRSTPWRLSGLTDQDLTLALVRGWIESAVEVLPENVELIHAWGNRRCEEVRGNEYELEVGHYDLLALPPVDAD